MLFIEYYTELDLRNRDNVLVSIILSLIPRGLQSSGYYYISPISYRLLDYGYKGRVATIAKWESGAMRIPVLVYELVLEKFTERRR